VPGASGFQSQYTPGGLLFKEGDSNMQYVTSTAFLLLAYAKFMNSLYFPKLGLLDCSFYVKLDRVRIRCVGCVIG
jgi:hypothetical protein